MDKKTKLTWDYSAWLSRQEKLETKGNDYEQNRTIR